jgi:molecular chaperone HtpG
MLEQLGHPVPKAKPVLELNPSHPVIPKLQEIFRQSSADPRLANYAQLLFGLAHLSESGQVPDPTSFGTALTDLMTSG